MMTNVFLWFVIILILFTSLLIVLHHVKIGFLQNKKYKAILYSVLTVEIIILLLTVLGRPLLGKLYTYRDNVLSESEEECKRADAPFWCNL